MKNYAILLVLLLGVSFVSCSDESTDAAAFKITERNMDITAAGGTMTVILSVEGDEASSDQSWCTPALSGKAVTLTLDANVGLEGRTALVTVKKGMENVSFPVTQPGNTVPRPDVNTIVFDAHGGTREIAVEHTLPFKAELPEGGAWLESRVSDGKLILTTQTNYTRKEYTTTVKLVSGAVESEIAVTQTGIELIPEKTSVVIYHEGGEVKIGVKSILPFEAVSDQDWLTVTKDETSVTLNTGDNRGKPARTATVTLTSKTLTAEIHVTQRAPIVYADYLGNWTLTGYDNGKAFTYNLSIDQAIAGSTYKISNWGESHVAIDPKFAIQARFDAKSELIFITGQENIGVFTDTDGSQFNIMFYGRVELDGKVYHVTGSGYICYIGQLQLDGSVRWSNGQVDVGFGPIPVVGANYFGVAPDGAYTFKGDIPFMREPTMIKAKARVASKAIACPGSCATRVETSKLISK